jgi:hypothetical protein
MATISSGNDRSDNDVVAFEFAPVLVVHGDGAVFVKNNKGVLHSFDDLEFVETDGSLVLGLDDWLLEGLAGRTTDVEGSHGELGSGLADRLRSDNADGFAELNHAACGEAATVALNANTTFGFASQG